MDYHSLQEWKLVNLILVAKWIDHSLLKGKVVNFILVAQWIDHSLLEWKVVSLIINGPVDRSLSAKSPL